MSDREPSRNELLNVGGDFTVADLRSAGLGKEVEDEYGNLGRELRSINDVVPTRLIPNSLLTLVENQWEQSQDITQVIESLWTSFSVFRATVNRGLQVPLVKKPDGLWEWPEPADFDWGDEQTKLLALMLGAYGRKSGVSVTVTKGNTVHRLSLADGVVSEEKVHEIVAHPEEHIRYKVPKLGDVRMINQQAWQMHALRTWVGVGHLMSAFDDMINQKLRTEDAETYIMSMVRILKDETHDMPVVRFEKDDEEGSDSNLFILEF